MEIPVLNRMTELAAGLSSLPNINILSQIFPSFSGFEKFSPSLHFWKWSAVIIALLATFSGILNRVKLLIINFRRKTSPIPKEREYIDSFPDHFRSSPFSCSVSGDENEPTSTSGNWEQAKESDFLVKGSNQSSNGLSYRRDSGLRRRHHTGEVDQVSFSWPYFGLGLSIVKQWENVRLGCDFDEFSGSVISLYDANKEHEICSIFGSETQMQAASFSPPMMVLSAGKGISGNVSIGLWDTRVQSQTPVVLAEWNPPSGNIVDVYSGGGERAFIGENPAAGVTVGDVRKVSLATENSTEGGVDGWLDADEFMNL